MFENVCLDWCVQILGVGGCAPSRVDGPSSDDDDDNTDDYGDGDSSGDSDYDEKEKDDSAKDAEIAERLFSDDSDSEQDKSEDVGVQWKSSNKFPSLNADERSRLPTQLQRVLKSGSFKSIGNKPGLYKFVHLVTKRFKTIMNQ